MKAYRHVYLDFPDFTQERCYEVTSKVTFQNGIKYEEVEHYSVIHTVHNDLAVYYGTFDMKEAADERCEGLNKMWEEWFGEQK